MSYCESSACSFVNGETGGVGASGFEAGVAALSAYVALCGATSCKETFWGVSEFEKLFVLDPLVVVVAVVLGVSVAETDICGGFLASPAFFLSSGSLLTFPATDPILDPFFCVGSIESPGL